MNTQLQKKEAPAIDWRAKAKNTQAVQRAFQSEGAREHIEGLISGSNITFDRLLGTTCIALQKNPALLKASHKSILLAVLDGLKINLEPNGMHGALVPYAGSVQFLPMYRGLLKIAREEGVLENVISAVVVREGDAFDHWIDDSGQHVRYKQNLKSDERGEPTAVFVQMKMKDGTIITEMRPMDWIEKRRKVSKTASRSDSPWKKWFEEMAIKTVLKSFCKRCDGISPRMADAVRIDDAAESDNVDLMRRLPRVEPAETKSKFEEHLARIDAEEEAAEVTLVELDGNGNPVESEA